MHDVRRGGTKRGAEMVEIFEVGFVNSVPNNFDVEVVKVSGRKTFTEIRR